MGMTSENVDSDVVVASLTKLLHNHLEHLYELFRPIETDARVIQELQEVPPVKEQTPYARGYRITRRAGELINRTLNTLLMCLSSVEDRSPSARLAIGIGHMVRSRLSMPMDDREHFIVNGNYEDVCRDIMLLQDTVAVTLAEVQSKIDPSLVVAEKLFVVYSTSCPICNKVMGSQGWKEFERALELRSHLSRRGRTQSGIPFVYKYVVVDMQGNAYKYFPFFLVEDLVLPILIYYNPMTCKLVVWHSGIGDTGTEGDPTDPETYFRKVGTMDPFTRILDKLLAYFIPHEELPEDVRRRVDWISESWRFVYRTLFEEKPPDKLPRTPISTAGRPPSKAKQATGSQPPPPPAGFGAAAGLNFGSSISMERYVVLQTGEPKITYYRNPQTFLRKDMALTEICLYLYRRGQVNSIVHLWRLIRSRCGPGAPGRSFVSRLVHRYGGILFEVSRLSKTQTLVRLTELGKRLARIVDEGVCRTIGEAFMRIYGNDDILLIGTKYEDQIETDFIKAKVAERRKAEKAA